jgi:hypothetical protein
MTRCWISSHTSKAWKGNQGSTSPVNEPDIERKQSKAMGYSGRISPVA